MQVFLAPIVFLLLFFFLENLYIVLRRKCFPISKHSAYKLLLQATRVVFFFRQFVALNFSQLQYKNPNVQILCMKDVTPTPFITFYLGKCELYYY